jgi:integrase
MLAFTDIVTVATIAGYTGRGIEPWAAGFARRVVATAAPGCVLRARSLLWACSRLAQWGATVGLEPVEAVLLHRSVIERFVQVGLVGRSDALRRTARTNLRFVAGRCGVLVEPRPAALRRTRAKAPYTPAEVDAWLALAAAQPSEVRRQHLAGLLCLGLGAGLERAELRGVTGGHVQSRSGGVVVAVEGRRPRRVPVLARYHQRLLASARFAGDGFVCGGMSPTRKNVTSNLVDRLAGGDDLGRLDVGRLRATWLVEHLDRLGIAALFSAAGITCSQRIGDLATRLPTPDEATLVTILDGRCPPA